MLGQARDPGSRLRRALDSNRRELEGSIAEAERELEAYQKRSRELETLISRAKAALGVNAGGSDGPPRRIGFGNEGGRPKTLHVLMAEILRELGDSGLTAKELADKVNESGLYRKRDGSAVEYNQIHARVHNYPGLFVKRNGRIFLSR